MKYNKTKNGFTLIELLVVVAIIGLMSSITLNSLQSARDKAKNAVRLKTITSLQPVLELYYSDFGHYPISANWRDSVHNPNDWIPGLVPTYIKSLPQEPNYDLNLCMADNPPAADGNGTSYRYMSDGNTYKIHDHCPPITPEMTNTSHPLYHCPNGGGSHPFSWSVCVGPGCPNIWCDAND